MNSPQIDSKRDLRCFVVGILKGEGSGPEVIDAACNVLDAVAETCGIDFRIKTGGNIAWRSTECQGGYLSEAVTEFCLAVFASGGAITAGPPTRTLRQGTFRGFQSLSDFRQGVLDRLVPFYDKRFAPKWEHSRREAKEC